MLLSLFCGATVCFFYFCCLNERNIMVLIFHHQRPLDFIFATLSEAGGCCIPLFFLSFLVSFCSSAVVFCMLFSPRTRSWIRAARRRSRFCWGGKKKKKAKNPSGWGEDAKVGFACRCKDAAWLCRDRGCNATTDGLTRDGAGPNPSTKVLEKLETKVASH